MSLVGAKDVPPVGDAKSRSDKALCPPHRALTARLTKQHSGQCDLGFPQCQRCIDLRLACPGPRVGAFFVHAQANASQPAAAQVQQALTRIPPTSALKACRADAFDQLFVSHFIDSFGLPKTVSTGPTWLESLPSFLGARSNALAMVSIRSASMLSYGTWARDEAIQADSYRWYASALAQLRHATAQGSRQPAPTLEMAVCAAVMLIHFETWAGTSRNAWVYHVKGAASLLQAAGPEACRGGFLQSVFSHLRFQVFIASMQENTLHTFAEPQWLHVPFREQAQTLFDELVDALFSVQRCLFFVQQNVDIGAVKGEETCLEIRSLTDAAANQLSTWSKRHMVFLRPASWAQQACGGEVTSSGKTGDADLIVTATPIPGPPEAALMSLFHAGRLIVTQLASATDGSLRSTAEEDSQIILQANAFSVRSTSLPSTKLRPFLMLPSLKIASLWSPLSEVRSQARALLLNEQILASSMADLALTSEGYFSQIAPSIR